MNGNEIKQKLSNKYSCEKCDYHTDRKSNLNNHNMSAKHLKSMNSNIIKQNLSNLYCCENCEKTYKDYSGLWRHKKKCNHIETTDICNKNNESVITPELIMEILKQNSELTNKIVDICKNGTHNTTSNSHNNSNNSFKLNFFLNETCKGALNISEFVDSLKLQLKDLENVGKFGYVEGISKIIINGLKDLDVTKRPIHCSDLKRETLYVKDDNIWENDKEKERMKNTIQHVAAKNFKQLHEWVNENPESKDTESKKHDEYMRIINKITGGMTDEEDDKNYNKIIKKVATEVVIEKEP